MSVCRVQCEAIPESLKNMLLVMHTAGILRRQTEDTTHGEDAGEEESQLWKLTWDQINSFLPNLHNDVFKPHEIGRSSHWLLTCFVSLLFCFVLFSSSPVYTLLSSNHIQLVC